MMGNKWEVCDMESDAWKKVLSAFDAATQEIERQTVAVQQETEDKKNGHG